MWSGGDDDEKMRREAYASAMAELVAHIAHEVNQPLAAIVANAQAGRRFLSGGTASRAEIDEILVDIAQQGVRASEVIKRLRGFLRKRPGDQRALDVDEEVRAALPLIRRELQDHSVEVRLDLDADRAGVLGDPVQLQQVLINLLKNACEAMSSKSGPRIVTLRTRATSASAVIEVRDTGPGVPTELMPRLFQPFVTTKPMGMGLGLPICKSIAEAHGGTLSAEVAEEGGMSFKIVLPTIDPASPAPKVRP
jgi:C4-dicarboxylate-specific signal transduction histidine kinase